MPPFFEEITRKLADKWLSLLVLPGLLLDGTAAVAVMLGHRRWADSGRLVDRADRLAAGLAARPAAASALLVVGVLLTAAFTGLAATALGQLVERLWTGRWPGWIAPVTRALTRRRRHRWTRMADEHDALVNRLYGSGADDTPRRRELARRRNAVSLTEPALPTWMGDRMAAVQTRVFTDYHVDLVAAWPRLWLLLPDDRRTEVREAASAFQAAATLAGWGTLYLAVGVLWWPSAVAGVITWLTAWSRGRRDIAAYADLAESVVDLHLGSLGEQLGVTAAGPADLGAAINSRLRKGA